MKIRITFDLGDEERRAIADLTGKRIASYKDCVLWIEGTVTSTLQDIRADYNANRESTEENP